MAAKEPFNVTVRPPLELAQPRSQWGHSPVPYLFGGLAAMLGLIAFALLILACSYWKLSGYLESGGGEGSGQGERDLEAGDATEKSAQPQVLEQKFLVIMAGEVKPTFLATPASSRTSSFGEKSNSSSSCSCENNEKLEEETEKQDQVQSSIITTTHEATTDQGH